MFTDPYVFTLKLLMNGSLGIPTAIRATIVAPTSAKATCLAHKTKRRERRQPHKPLWRIGLDVQFSLLWADQHVMATGSIFNQWDQAVSLLGGMANQWSHCRLVQHRQTERALAALACSAVEVSNASRVIKRCSVCCSRSWSSWNARSVS